MASTSESIIIKILEHIFRKRGIFDGSEDWPTLRDLYNVVTYKLEREKLFRYKEVLLLLQNRLDPYIYSEHFNCKIGIPEEIWRTENVVLELGKGFTDNMYSVSPAVTRRELPLGAPCIILEMIAETTSASASLLSRASVLSTP